MGYVRAALAYLERYGGPRARIERTLARRAGRKGLEADAAQAIVAEAMARLDRMEVVDDGAFAAGKAQALRRRGASRRAALMKLRATGVDPDLAGQALAALDAASDAPERDAARRYAQRRRLGLAPGPERARGAPGPGYRRPGAPGLPRRPRDRCD
jgi:regulatory protein